MPMRTSHRTAGEGCVHRHSHSRKGYDVCAPQTKGKPRVIVWQCETRWEGERALKAWYVVGAVVLLAQMGAPCERIAS